MNLYHELDRITQATAASRVRTLPLEEVVYLNSAGRITPVEQILTQKPRVCVPLKRRSW
jgi:hypothetical protein